MIVPFVLWLLEFIEIFNFFLFFFFKKKSIVFGGLDGIITTFAIVAGASGGSLGVETILILGFSNIFADALSMGVGDALSSKAEAEYIKAERKREQW